MECRYCHMTNHLIATCPRLNNKKNKNQTPTINTCQPQENINNNGRNFGNIQTRPKFLGTKTIPIQQICNDNQTNDEIPISTPPTIQPSKYLQALLKKNFEVVEEKTVTEPEKFNITKLEFLSKVK